MVRQCSYADLHGCGDSHPSDASTVQVASSVAAEDRDNACLWCGCLVSIPSRDGYQFLFYVLTSNYNSVIATSSARLYELTELIESHDFTSASPLPLPKCSILTAPRNKFQSSSLVLPRSQRLHNLRLPRLPPPPNFPHLLLLLPAPTPPLLPSNENPLHNRNSNPPHLLPQTLDLRPQPPRRKHLPQRCLLRRPWRIYG